MITLEHASTVRVGSCSSCPCLTDDTWTLCGLNRSLDFEGEVYINRHDQVHPSCPLKTDPYLIQLLPNEGT